MIVGTGIDVVDVARMERWMEVPGLCERYFHPEELKAVRSRGKGAARSLAGRFAVKEALMKAIRSELAGICLKDICVINEQNGQPCVQTEGQIVRMLEQKNVRQIHVSLAHEKQMAVAQIILEA